MEWGTCSGCWMVGSEYVCVALRGGGGEGRGGGGGKGERSLTVGMLRVGIQDEGAKVCPRQQDVCDELGFYA